MLKMYARRKYEFKKKTCFAVYRKNDRNEIFKQVCEEILYNKKPNSYQQLHAGISVWISKNDLMSNSSRF